MMKTENIIFPAEWAEQAFVQLAFPHEKTDWVYMLENAQRCFCEIIEAILQFENVLLVVQEPRAKSQEPKLAKLTEFAKKSNFQFSIFNFQLNDTWARDHAGITVFIDGKPTVLDFCFNAWGKKFDANFDNQITSKLFAESRKQKSQFSIFNYKNCLNFILEGGSIESDGAGTILTTEKCLLSENRNNLTTSEIEEKFKHFFGTKRVLWLKNGYLAGDDTDSHIDTLARFCNENTIAYVKCEDENDEHFAALKAMEEELQNFRTFNNKPYNLVPLPMADAVFDENGERLPATYANFLIINGAVLMPTYSSPKKDEMAAQILQSVFTNRKILKINCLPLIQQHGSLHCVTMQFPK